MINIRQLLANNIKESRKKLGLSQAKLAEKANLSTQYLAMIELTHKFPSPEKFKQIAIALEIDTPELFSMPPSAKIASLKLQRAIVTNIEKAVEDNVQTAIRTVVCGVVTAYLSGMEITGENKKEREKFAKKEFDKLENIPVNK